MEQKNTDKLRADKKGVLHEITPLMNRKAIYLVDRHKKAFNYPLHVHDAFELNFVSNAPGVRRVIGDSTETIGDLDLVLITNPNMEHAWEQGDCQSEDIREITIQFNFGGEDAGLFGESPFQSIHDMIDKARRGVCFSRAAIEGVIPMLDTMCHTEDEFDIFMQFIRMLHTLSLRPDSRLLASPSFSRVVVEDESDRILRVKEYISKNYSEELRLSQLAGLACMSESSFSRFFKLRTGRTLTEYIIDVRLGNAIYELVNTRNSVAQISFNCGFNNQSNFNRIFRKRKQCSPMEFRDKYRSSRVIL